MREVKVSFFIKKAKGDANKKRFGYINAIGLGGLIFVLLWIILLLIYPREEERKIGYELSVGQAKPSDKRYRTIPSPRQMGSELKPAKEKINLSGNWDLSSNCKERKSSTNERVKILKNKDDGKEYYRWVDAQGVGHITYDKSDIPSELQGELDNDKTERPNERINVSIMQNGKSIRINGLKDNSFQCLFEGKDTNLTKYSKFVLVEKISGKKIDCQVIDPSCFSCTFRNKLSHNQCLLKFDNKTELVEYSSTTSIQSAVSSSQPQPQPYGTTNSKWYEGGTLHKESVANWKSASFANKLATAADWAIAIPRIKQGVIKSGKMETLAPLAYQLVKCVDEACSGGGDESMGISEVAASCMILMRWTK